MKTCSVDHCEQPVRAKGLCRPHYRLSRGESKFVRRERPEGTYSQGYRYLYRPEHPNAEKGGRLGEHRLVMSEILERSLRPGETVHHRNGDKLDNRPENLELWLLAPGKHRGSRVTDLIAWAKEILRTYEDSK